MSGSKEAQATERETFGATMRRLRHDAGLTLRGCAAALAVSENYVWRLEKDVASPPNPIRCGELERAFGVMDKELQAAANAERTARQLARVRHVRVSHLSVEEVEAFARQMDFKVVITEAKERPLSALEARLLAAFRAASAAQRNAVVLLLQDLAGVPAMPEVQEEHPTAIRQS